MLLLLLWIVLLVARSTCQGGPPTEKNTTDPTPPLSPIVQCSAREHENPLVNEQRAIFESLADANFNTRTDASREEPPPPPSQQTSSGFGSVFENGDEGLPLTQVPSSWGQESADEDGKDAEGTNNQRSKSPTKVPSGKLPLDEDSELWAELIENDRVPSNELSLYLGRQVQRVTGTRRPFSLSQISDVDSPTAPSPKRHKPNPSPAPVVSPPLVSPPLVIPELSQSQRDWEAANGIAWQRERQYEEWMKRRLQPVPVMTQTQSSLGSTRSSSSTKRKRVKWSPVRWAAKRFLLTFSGIRQSSSRMGLPLSILDSAGKFQAIVNAEFSSRMSIQWSLTVQEASPNSQIPDEFHYHCVVVLENKVDFRRSVDFDVLGLHPNVRPIYDMAQTLEYVLKQFSSLDQFVKSNLAETFQISKPEVWRKKNEENIQRPPGSSPGSSPTSHPSHSEASQATDISVFEKSKQDQQHQTGQRRQRPQRCPRQRRSHQRQSQDELPRGKLRQAIDIIHENPRDAMERIDEVMPQLIVMQGAKLESYRDRILQRIPYNLPTHIQPLDVSKFRHPDIRMVATWVNEVLHHGRRGKKFNLYVWGTVNLQKTSFLMLLQELLKVYVIPRDHGWRPGFIPNEFDGIAVDGIRSEFFQDGSLSTDFIEAVAGGAKYPMSKKYQSATYTHGKEFMVILGNLKPSDIKEIDPDVFNARFITIHLTHPLGPLIDEMRRIHRLEPYRPPPESTLRNIDGNDFSNFRQHSREKPPVLDDHDDEDILMRDLNVLSPSEETQVPNLPQTQPDEVLQDSIDPSDIGFESPRHLNPWTIPQEAVHEVHGMRRAWRERNANRLNARDAPGSHPPRVNKRTIAELNDIWDRHQKRRKIAEKEKSNPTDREVHSISRITHGPVPVPFEEDGIDENEAIRRNRHWWSTDTDFSCEEDIFHEETQQFLREWNEQIQDRADAEEVVEDQDDLYGDEDPPPAAQTHIRSDHVPNEHEVKPRDDSERKTDDETTAKESHDDAGNEHEPQTQKPSDDSTTDGDDTGDGDKSDGPGDSFGGDLEDDLFDEIDS